jgi:hypothetical protein
MPLKKSHFARAWTRPVPWVGVNRLSSDIDAATVQSQTIRYQRDLIRRYMREAHGVLEKEVALLEFAPGQATLENLKILKDLVGQEVLSLPKKADLLNAQDLRPYGGKP